MILWCSGSDCRSVKKKMEILGSKVIALPDICASNSSLEKGIFSVVFDQVQ